VRKVVNVVPEIVLVRVRVSVVAANGACAPLAEFHAESILKNAVNTNRHTRTVRMWLQTPY